MIFWVGSVPIPVHEVDRDELDGDDAEYTTESGAPEIWIAEELEGKWRDQVLAHEWAHAWLQISGVGRMLELDDSQEELFCDILAHDLVRLTETVSATLCPTRWGRPVRYTAPATVTAWLPGIRGQ